LQVQLVPLVHKEQQVRVQLVQLVPRAFKVTKDLLEHQVLLVQQV
jgi:hypothetical protein